MRAVSPKCRARPSTSPACADSKATSSVQRHPVGFGPQHRLVTFDVLAKQTVGSFSIVAWSTTRSCGDLPADAACRPSDAPNRSRSTVALVDGTTIRLVVVGPAAPRDDRERCLAPVVLRIDLRASFRQIRNNGAESFVDHVMQGGLPSSSTR